MGLAVGLEKALVNSSNSLPLLPSPSFLIGSKAEFHSHFAGTDEEMCKPSEPWRHDQYLWHENMDDGCETNNHNNSRRSQTAKRPVI
jgi:hypothetical protein